MSALKQWLERRREEPKLANYGPIGVYLSKNSLHLAQLRRLFDGELGFQSQVSLRYPGGRGELLSSRSAVQKLVRRAMRAGKFKGRTVVSAMPPEQVRVMSVSYPASNSGNDAAAIMRLMAERLEGELQDYVIDYVPIRMSSNDGDRLALVAVSNVEHVSAYLASLDASGLHVNHLEIGPVALQRLIRWGSPSNQRGNVIVLSVDNASSNLTTISGDRLLAEQEIRFCQETILDALANSLSLDQAQVEVLLLQHGLSTTKPAELAAVADWDPEIAATLIEIVKPEFLNLMREIDRAFLYADSESHGDGTKKLFIRGEISQWPGAVNFLGSLGTVQADVLGADCFPKPSDASDSAAIDEQRAAELSTAVGLAMRGMLDHD